LLTGGIRLTGTSFTGMTGFHRYRDAEFEDSEACYTIDTDQWRWQNAMKGIHIREGNYAARGWQRCSRRGRYKGCR